MTRRGRAAGLPSVHQREGVAQQKKIFFSLGEGLDEEREKFGVRFILSQHDSAPLSPPPRENLVYIILYFCLCIWHFGK